MITCIWAPRFLQTEAQEIWVTYPSSNSWKEEKQNLNPRGLSLSEPTLLINAEYFQQIILNQCTL